MKNAPDNKAAESANTRANHKTNALPKRINSVIAGVLAALIEGHAVIGIDAVFKQSATRAAACIHYLEVNYGWHIERRDIATGTNDGRMAWLSAYWLTTQTREAAYAVGPREWIAKVKTAAAKRRKQAHAVKAKAARLYALRVDPRQGEFWEGL